MLENLNYCSNTGQFTWKSTGKVAGSKNSDGYLRISIKRKKYMAHHLAWLLHYGYLPKKLDHKNGVPYDNRIINLRLATDQENSQNKKNCKGIKQSSKNSWEARIRVNGKYIYLGTAPTKELAEALYHSAKKTYHPFYIPREQILDAERVRYKDIGE